MQTLRKGTPTHCLTCKQPMRSRRATAEQQPGTVVHGARGYCVADYDKIRSEAAAEARKQKHSKAAVHNEAANLAGLNRYMAERARRIRREQSRAAA